MAGRFEIREKLISDYGEGAFPSHRDVSYQVIDNENPWPDGRDCVINTASTREGAVEKLKVRYREAVKRTEARRKELREAASG